jgi:hypothetical protein
VRGSWRFDGRSFGQHQTPSPEYEYLCASGTEPNSVEMELRFASGGRAPYPYAYVTFFPLDDKRDIDVVMPWSHLRFTAADCSRHNGSAMPGVVNNQKVLAGRLQLTCAKQDDTLDFDLTYSCPAGGGGAPRTGPMIPPATF